MNLSNHMTGVLDQWLAARLEAVHTCIPGKVVAYDGHATRRAKVKPLVKLFSVAGSRVELPEIMEVPLVFPSTAAGGLVLPVAAGDGVLLFFSEAGIGGFLQGQHQETDADDPTRFSLHDCIAVPGLWPFGAVPAIDAGAGDVVLAMGGQKVTLAADGSVEMTNGAGTFKITAAGLLTMTSAASGMKAQIDALWQEIIKLSTALTAGWGTIATLASPTAPVPPVPPVPWLVTAMATNIAAMVPVAASETAAAALVPTLLED